MMALPGSKYVKFVAVSAVSSLANLLSRIAFGWFVGFEVSIVLAICIGLSTAFVLNRLFVFEGAHGAASVQFVRFLIVNLLTLVQVFIISLLFADVIFPAMAMTWQPETMAHAIGLLSPLLTSYWAHKHFTFGAGKAEAKD
jgi:putative flippase GtrA